jgi:hypothetical protein
MRYSGRMRNLLLVVLAACGAKPPVVTWATSSTGATERIELQRSGEGRYTSTISGAPDREERVILSSDQVAELDEMFRSQRVCELAHDPSYTPAPDEGQTTLVLAFPDQRCTIVLWNHEWEHGRAQPISETMRSMRPLRQPPGRAR